MARDEIILEGLRTQCVIGVWEHERLDDQPIELELRLGLDLAEAAHQGELTATVNYDRVADQVLALLRFRRYGLLEVAAHELTAMLFGCHPRLETVELTLRKPQALVGRAAAAVVRTRRSRGDLPRRRELTSFGHVDILVENDEAGLYLLQIAPGRAIAPHHHQRMRELEWYEAGELYRDGQRLTGLAPVVWPHGLVHTYDNRGTTMATVFCCDVPRFDRRDERVVDLPPGTLVAAGAEDGTP